MSISLQDFNLNFKVQIRNIAVPHVDETGIVPGSIGFNVICLLNSRVQYFEYHILDQNIVNTYTSQQLVDYAWNQLKTDVNTWATSAMSESNLIGYVYVPTSDFNTSTITLATFNQNYTMKIVRFEVYPANDPSSWCVGYNISNNLNDSTLYISTNVMVATFEISQTEIQIMDAAWNQIKDTIAIWASEKLMYSSLINTDYVPSAF